MQHSAQSLSKGVNVISYFGKCLGLSQSARLIVLSLQEQNIPFSLISAESLAPGHPSETFEFPITNEFIYPINIFCLDPEHSSIFIERMNWDRIQHCYNIGIFFWETNRLPEKAKKWWKYLDEVWATTNYVHEHLSIASPLPVYRIPQPVTVPTIAKNKTKEDFNLKNHFTFLFYFSFFSILQRKNPQAIINAFKKAFETQQNVQLVIKSQNGKHFPDQLNHLKKEIQNDPRIIWLEQTMDQQASYELMNVCDCYVSLHRSEGFGLTLAEAMLLEKPVIATGYSGNLDFMNLENSFLCSHLLIPVGKGHFYPSKGVWADVDIDQAAFWMDYVFHHPEEAQSKAKKGRNYILNHHSYETTGKHIAWRLAKIPEITSKPRPLKHFKGQIIQKLRSSLKKIKQPLKRLIRKG